MRNLQNLLFLSLLGLVVSTGCTITTSDDPNFDDDASGGTGNTAGNTTSVTGGTVGAGGTTVAAATGGSATGGAATTTTGPTYTAADCPALASVAPAPWAADVTASCVTCMYSANKACTEAAACHNDVACAQQVFAALECIQLYFQYAGDVPITLDERDACQTGELTAPPASSSEVPVKSNNAAAAWLGASVGTTAGITLMSALMTNCATECNATLDTTP